MRILLKFVLENQGYEISEIYKVDSDRVLDVFVCTPKESETVMSNPLVLARFGKTIGCRLIRTWITGCDRECSAGENCCNCGKYSPQLHRKMTIDTAIALEEYCQKYGIT